MSTDQGTDTANERAGVALSDEEDEIVAGPPWYKVWKNWMKIFIGIGLITLLVLGFTVFGDTTNRILNDFLTWVENNIAIGSFAFIGVYWFCTVFLIPGSLLTLGAGFVFSQAVGSQAGGVFLATLVVWIGATVGAINAFIFGRFLIRDKIDALRTKHPKFEIVDQLVEKNGLKVTVLVRLSPVIPFNILNYLMGITSVTLRDYSIACLAMIPGTLAYCFIGGSLGSLADAGNIGDNVVSLVVIIVGTVLAIIGMVVVGWYGKKEFDRLVAELPQKDDENGDAEMAGPVDNDEEKLNQQDEQLNLEPAQSGNEAIEM